MVTGQASKTWREGSIPSRSAQPALATYGHERLLRDFVLRGLRPPPALRAGALPCFASGEPCRARREDGASLGVDAVGAAAGGRSAATSAVSGPISAVSPEQHSAWFTPCIGQSTRTHAAWPCTYTSGERQSAQRKSDIARIVAQETECNDRRSGPGSGAPHW